MNPAIEIILLIKGASDQQLIDFVSKFDTLNTQLGTQGISYVSSKKVFLPEEKVPTPLSADDEKMEYE